MEDVTEMVDVPGMIGVADGLHAGGTAFESAVDAAADWDAQPAGSSPAVFPIRNSFGRAEL